MTRVSKYKIVKAQFGIPPAHSESSASDVKRRNDIIEWNKYINSPEYQNKLKAQAQQTQIAPTKKLSDSEKVKAKEQKIRLNSEYIQNKTHLSLDNEGNIINNSKYLNMDGTSKPHTPAAQRDKGFEGLLNAGEAAMLLDGIPQIYGLGKQLLKKAGPKSTQSIIRGPIKPPYEGDIINAGGKGYVPPTTDPKLMATEKMDWNAVNEQIKAKHFGDKYYTSNIDKKQYGGDTSMKKYKIDKAQFGTKKFLSYEEWVQQMDKELTGHPEIDKRVEDEYQAYADANAPYALEGYKGVQKADSPQTSVSELQSKFQSTLNQQLPQKEGLENPSQTLKKPKGLGTNFERLKLSGTGGIDDIFNLGEGLSNIGNGDKGNPIGKAFGIINPAARIITNVANKVDDIKNSKDEREQYLKSLQSPDFNMNEDGNDNPIYTQYGGPDDESDEDDSQQVEAEEGEVYTTQDGGMQKVPEGSGTHEEGGTILDNVERVLEDTSSKRNDIISQALRVSPKMASLIADVPVKKSTSHSKLMELASEKNFKEVKKIEGKIRKNIESLKNIPNNVYAQNSLDMNLMNLNKIPTDGELFDEIFDHQEFVKASLGAQMPKAQYGGKYGIVRAQNGYDRSSKDPSQGFNRIPNNAKRNEWSFRDGLWFHDKTGTTVNPSRPSVTTPSGDGIRSSSDPTQGFNRIPNNAKRNEWSFLDGLWYHDGGKGGTTTRASKTPVKALSTDGYILDGYKGITQKADSPETSISKFQSALNDSQYKESVANTDSTSTINNTPQEPSPFNEPLTWSDLAGPMHGLLEGRIPAKYNPAQLHQIRLQKQNPLPALQAGQTSYNAAINNLPATGVGNANAANIFTAKYNIDNQLLGQTDTINRQIQNQQDMYNAGIRDKQEILDQSARDVFEGKYLGSKEALRQQRLTSWDEIYQRIALNKKLNREGNLLMKLFPNFNQNAQFNGNQARLRMPLNTSTYTIDKNKIQQHKK